MERGVLVQRSMGPANTVARSPAPIRSKSGAVPANDGLQPNNRNRVQDAGKPAIEPNEQKTIGIVQIWSLRHPPAKHVNLLPQNQILRFQPCPRPKERSHDAKNQLEQISHQAASFARPFPASTSNRIIGTHSHAGDAIISMASELVRHAKQPLIDPPDKALSATHQTPNHRCLHTNGFFQ
jgi:hypothetical protein